MNNAYIRAQQLKVKEAKFPFVKIGGQYWTTKNLSLAVTPQGNTIPEVQANATWATSQTLYDNTYAAAAGTVEQKTYAAVKAAAMWCNYNNDAPTGGIYGKLYNWFAVKLFQMDIDYYNVANPTKPYIWRVPTQAEFQTLSDYLGGDAVSGGHLKEIGTTHWGSPNTGADNSSGFAALGSGLRLETGVFTGSFNNYGSWEIDKNRSSITNTSSSVILGITDIVRGYSIRLIKA